MAMLNLSQMRRLDRGAVGGKPGREGARKGLSATSLLLPAGAAEAFGTLGAKPDAAGLECFAC